jgi:hypothetical protein
MGCFGDMEATKHKTSTQTQNLPAYLQAAAEKNVGMASSFADRPFESYTAPRVAGLSGNETDAFGLIRNIAGSPNPYLSDIEGLYNRFSNTPASTVSAPSIIGPNTDVRSSSVQDYMTPYLQSILAPMMQEIERKGFADRKSLDAQATMDGAFGDARSGIERGEQRRNEDILRTNVMGTEGAKAFDRATQLRSADVSNLMDSQKTNASFMEQFLQRAITGAKGLEGLDASQLARGLTTADALAKAGGVERGIEQKKLDAGFEEFLRGQGWDAEKIKLFTGALAGTPYSKTTTGDVTESQPDNSGWGFLGSAAGALLPTIGKGMSTLLPAILSDRRMKYDVVQIGQLYDGLRVYRFKYVGDDTVHIGLMAQEVEKVYPDAVTHVDGVKFVDYGKATFEAASMGEV